MCRVWGGGATLETVEVCPQVQSMGTVWVSPHPRGSGSCAHGDHMSAPHLQCVLSPQRFPTCELRVLPWLACGPFSPCHLVAFHEVRHLWVGCCSVFCWVKTFGGVTLIHSTAHANSWGHNCLVSPRPSSGNLVFKFFLIFTLFYFTILYWFCHTLTWIHHGCIWVPNPEPPSHLPPHISLDHPRG